ncbi:MAG: OmpH family outer membrane protein [Bacteroidia bacterium]
MKKVIKTAIVAIVLFATSIQVNAQKIAHISVDSLLAVMPESQAAKKAAQDYYNQLQGQVVSMQKELQTKYQDYQQNQANYTDLVKQTKQKELNDLNQRIQDFQTQAQQDIQKKNDDLTKPVYQKAKKAINEVAKEKGYKYVLDTSSGVVLYSDPSDDIMDAVRKKLGIDPNAKPAMDNSTPTSGSSTAPTN